MLNLLLIVALIWPQEFGPAGDSYEERNAAMQHCSSSPSRDHAQQLPAHTPFWPPANNRAATGQLQPGYRAEIPTGRGQKKVQPGNRAEFPTGQPGRHSNRAG